MDDSSALVETVAQWISVGPTHHEIDSEIGDLSGDVLGGKPQFTYARYDLSLEGPHVKSLRKDVSKDVLETLTEMDIPDNMPLLLDLARRDAKNTMLTGHLPPRFDLG
jgi:hypothetical protein